MGNRGETTRAARLALAAAATAMTLLLGAGTGQAATVIRTGSRAIGIDDLLVDAGIIGS